MTDLVWNGDMNNLGNSLTIKVEEEGMLICDVCGKEMTIVTDNGEKHAEGMNVQVCCQGNDIPREFIQKQMGKYKIGKTYRLCHECILKSYGVKA